MTVSRVTIWWHRCQALRRLDLSSGVAELGGMAAIVAGTWMVYEPAAFVIAGIGSVLWAQGKRASARRKDE